MISGLRALSATQADRLLAVGLLVLAQAEVWLSPAVAGRRPGTALAAAVMTLALVGRRRYPTVTALLVTGAVVALGLVSGLPNAVFLLPASLVALYSLGAYARPEGSALGLAAVLVMLPVGSLRIDDPTVTDLTAPLFLFVVAWAFGRAMRGRRQRDAELRSWHADTVHAQAVREREAVTAERRRIARELHDIVAHRVTTIVVQAESGAATAEDPDLSRRAFGTIADSGRQALDELRRLLGLLRDAQSPPATSPLPGTALLGDLVAGVRAAGVEVDAELEGDLGGLPPGLDLAVYRIVQEGLTNALRHARDRVWLRVAREPARVLVEVRNPLPDGARPGPGPGPPAAAAPPPAGGAGRGLPGIRERVRIHGGRMSAGAEGSTWVLRAEFPLTGAER